MEFQNRKAEREQLDSIISNQSEENLIICIHSTAGVGKSAFTKEYFKCLEQNKASIRVKLPLKDSDCDQGYAVRFLANELSEKSKEKGYLSFTNFLIKNPSAEMKKYFISELTGTLYSEIPLANATLELLNNKLRAAIKSENTLFKLESDYSIIFCYEYIKYIMNLNVFFVVFENINVADRLSLNYLEKLFKETKHQIFILEYTDDEIEVNRFLQNAFSLKSLPVLYLKKLKSEDYIKIIEEKLKNMTGSENILLDVSACERIYNDLNGNLFNLLDDAYFEKIIPDIQINIKEITDAPLLISKKEHDILDLNETELIILTMIYIHPGLLCQDDLEAALLGYSRNIIFNNINANLKKLIPQYVQRRDDMLSINNEVISEGIFDNTFFLNKKYIAYSIWLDFYTARFNIDNSTSNLKMLILLLQKYDPEKIIAYRNDLLMIADRSASPQHAINFLSDISKSIKLVDKNTYLKISILLMDIYYNISLYNQSFSILNNIFHFYKEYPCLIAYKAFLLNRLDKQEEAINFIINALKINIVQDNARLKFVLLNILIVCYGTINNYKKATRIYNALLNNREINSNFPEYGYFLRNSVIIFDPQKSIDFLKESLNYFNNDIEKAHTLINYSMSLSRIGSYEDASYYLNEAEKLYMGKCLERHILHNNKVTNMLKCGELSEQMLYTLKMALITANTVFEKIVIYKNMLVISYKLKLISEQEAIVKEMLSLIESEPNNSLKVNTYLAISVYYDQFDKIKSSVYRQKAYEYNTRIVTTNATKWRALSSDKINNIDNLIGYLSYWHFPIDNNL